MRGRTRPPPAVTPLSLSVPSRNPVSRGDQSPSPLTRAAFASGHIDSGIEAERDHMFARFVGRSWEGSHGASNLILFYRVH